MHKGLIAAESRFGRFCVHVLAWQQQQEPGERFYKWISINHSTLEKTWGGATSWWWGGQWSAGWGFSSLSSSSSSNRGVTCSFSFSWVYKLASRVLILKNLLRATCQRAASVKAEKGTINISSKDCLQPRPLRKSSEKFKLTWCFLCCGFSCASSHHQARWKFSGRPVQLRWLHVNDKWLHVNDARAHFTGHMWFLSPVWVAVCLWRWDFCMNAFPQ